MHLRATSLLFVFVRSCSGRRNGAGGNLVWRAVMVKRPSLFMVVRLVAAATPTSSEALGVLSTFFSWSSLSPWEFGPEWKELRPNQRLGVKSNLCFVKDKVDLGCQEISESWLQARRWKARTLLWKVSQREWERWSKLGRPWRTLLRHWRNDPSVSFGLKCDWWEKNLTFL